MANKNKAVKAAAAAVVIEEKVDTATENMIVDDEQTSVKGAGFCVYIGPTIANVIQRGTIYQGNKTEILNGLAAQVSDYPLIASLLVSGDTLAADLIKVRTPGNLLNEHFRQLASAKTKGGKEE